MRNLARRMVNAIDINPQRRHGRQEEDDAQGVQDLPEEYRASASQEGDTGRVSLGRLLNIRRLPVLG